MSKNVAIIGASDDPDRYAYKAMQLLKTHGYNTMLVNPSKDMIEGTKCYRSIAEVEEPVDTITLYVRPAISSGMIPDILSANPRRVIMNPGTENDGLAQACEAHGIKVIFACTLVMLGAGQFDKE